MRAISRNYKLHYKILFIIIPVNLIVLFAFVPFVQFFIALMPLYVFYKKYKKMKEENYVVLYEKNNISYFGKEIIDWNKVKEMPKEVLIGADIVYIIKTETMTNEIFNDIMVKEYKIIEKMYSKNVINYINKKLILTTAST